MGIEVRGDERPGLTSDNLLDKEQVRLDIVAVKHRSKVIGRARAMRQRSPRFTCMGEKGRQQADSAGFI